MCGFVGFIDTKKKLSISENKEIIKNMSYSLKHRGPDYTGFWHNDPNNIFLSHNRLSIQDLSTRGNQPMLTDDNKLLILFNGEIYNHFSLRKELVASTPYKWKSTSDTETLIKCIQIWGLDKTLKKISGMFAFVLFDFQNMKIFLARDRFGEKPLYYGMQNDIFYFSSELKAIVKHPRFEKELNFSSINNYFFYGYIPSPKSIYKNIYKLSPASTVEISISNYKYKISKYWDFQKHCQLIKNQHHEDSIISQNIKELLTKSVKEKLISDVPVGCFLSGGSDSSVIAALMQDVSERKIQTFNVGFDEVNFDESIKAQKISKILGTNHHEITLNSKKCYDLIPKLKDIFCEPFADSSQIPTLLISEFAKKHVSVVLSGDAGDEIFGGYNRYLYSEYYFPKIKNIPNPLKKIISNILLRIPSKNFNFILNLINKFPIFNVDNREFGENIHKIAKIININRKSDLYGHFVGIFKESESILKMSYPESNIINFENTSDTENMVFNDLSNYLPEDILCKVDRSSMNYSLESRMPFLDLDLFKYAMSLPINKKIKKNTTKFPLKNILSEYLPKNLIYSSKKGFSIPVDQWLRKELKDWCFDTLMSSKSKNSEILNINNIKKILDDHMSHKQNNGKKIWTLLMFQDWYNHQC